MPQTTLPSVRVVVRLPWDRPDDPLPDPAPVEWNAEKADTLWKAIERSRSTDSGGADWKAIAAHLNMPLPYLLYRVNARFEEDIRGLKDIKGVLNPAFTQSSTRTPDAGHPDRPSPRDNYAIRPLNSSHLTTSGRSPTPHNVCARLNALNDNLPRRPKRANSSSTLTVQYQKKSFARLPPTISSSPEDTDSDDEVLRKEEETDRLLEEQELLDRKLQQLQIMMTSDALGLVASARVGNKGKLVERGRTESEVRRSMVGSYRHDAASSRSTSQSVSGASSPQGSIPDIPSPSSPQSMAARRLSLGKSTSPPMVSPQNVHGQRYRPLADHSLSERSSSHDSEASSFSDLSDASLSPSTLESALLSNTRGNGSRLSHFARSRMLGRS